MKIAHVVWGMKTGGVETMLVNIINEHVKTAEVRLFIVNNFIDEFVVEKIDSKCKIFRLNRKPKDKNPLKILKLNWWIWNYHPDIIHVHSYRVSKLIIGKWNIVRTVHNTRNIPDEYPKMKALFAISNIVKDEVVKQGFSKVKTICNGIVTDEIANHNRTAPPNGFYKIVQISRLDIKQKGQDLLISAINILVNKFNIRNFHLHFIGEGHSEPFLKKMVKDYDLIDYVTFEGIKNQDFIFKHLCDFDLFVQPSRFEGFGITVAEAIAAKVPVLVSDIEGPMEIIKNGKFGISFLSENIDNLVEKLQIVLSGGFDYSKIEPAYQHVKNNYDVSVTATKYMEAYKEIING